MAKVGSVLEEGRCSKVGWHCAGEVLQLLLKAVGENDPLVLARERGRQGDELIKLGAESVQFGADVLLHERVSADRGASNNDAIWCMLYTQLSGSGHGHIWVFAEHGALGQNSCEANSDKLICEGVKGLCCMSGFADDIYVIEVRYYTCIWVCLRHILKRALQGKGEKKGTEGISLLDASGAEDEIRVVRGASDKPTSGGAIGPAQKWQQARCVLRGCCEDAGSRDGVESVLAVQGQKEGSRVGFQGGAAGMSHTFCPARDSNAGL